MKSAVSDIADYGKGRKDMAMRANTFFIGCAEALLLAFTSSAGTVSEVRFPAGSPVSAEDLAVLAGEPVALRQGGGGMATAYLSNDAVEQLYAKGVEFEVLRTVTDLDDSAAEKALQSIAGESHVSIPINPVGSGSIVISGAPPGATVDSVTARLRGLVAFADLCVFQLRDQIDITYTFPTWTDMAQFDHTVTDISDFDGRPVNQTWTVYGQGGAVSGESITDWWLTIYYQDTAAEGEGESEGEPPAPLEFTRMPFGGWHEEYTALTLVVAVDGGTPPYTYQWLLDGNPISGANDAEYVDLELLQGETGDYGCRVTDAAMISIESDAAYIFVVAQGGLPAPHGLTLGCAAAAILLAAIFVLRPARRT